MSTGTSQHVYQIFVLSTPEKVWKAITDGEETQKYFFGSRVETDWKPGSPIRYLDPAGGPSSDGVILEIEPQKHLKATWKPGWVADSQPSTVSWDVESLDSSMLVMLTHTDIDEATFERAQMGIGWVFVLSSLKSLLETGEALDVPAIFG